MAIGRVVPAPGWGNLPSRGDDGNYLHGRSIFVPPSDRMVLYPRSPLPPLPYRRYAPSERRRKLRVRRWL